MFFPGFLYIRLEKYSFSTYINPEFREDIMEIMNSLLTLFTNTYMFCAVFGGALLVLMFILTLIGIGHEIGGCGGDCEVADGDIGTVGVLSLKGIIAFVTFYGLGGLCFKSCGWGGWLLSVGCGACMMFVTAAVITLILKLQHSGNIEPESMIGCSGSVYLSIPGDGENTGLVTVTLPAGTRQVRAVADEPLATGCMVTVAEYLGNNRYLVRKKD